MALSYYGTGHYGANHYGSNYYGLRGTTEEATQSGVRRKERSKKHRGSTFLSARNEELLRLRKELSESESLKVEFLQKGEELGIDADYDDQDTIDIVSILIMSGYLRR